MAEILVGDAYGQMHACSISSKSVTKTYGQVSANSHITHLAFDNKESPVYIFGHSSKTLYFYDLQEEKDTNIEIDSKEKIIGSSFTEDGGVYYSYEDSSIAYIAPDDIFGTIESQQIRFERQNLPKATSSYKKGELITDSLYCFVGFDVTPSLIDLTKQSLLWTGKNVPNDYLDLHVPIKDVDVFGNKEGNQLTVLHQDRKLRLYDIRKQQKKPALSLDFTFDKYKFTKIIQSPCENYVYIGGGQGSVFKLDKRKNYHMVYKLSGAKGAITSLEISPNNQHVATGSLDGYVRVYNENNNTLQQSLYISQPIHSLLFVDSIDLQALQQTRNRPVQKQLVPKRRNTVKLDYLKPRKFAKLQVKDEQDQKVKYQQQQ